jgi:hypothetical protein
MKYKKDNLRALEEVCKEVLEVSRKHSFLWEDPRLWIEDYRYFEEQYATDFEPSLCLFRGFKMPDESYVINITKSDEKMEFSGKSFCEYGESDPKKSALLLREYNISSPQLKRVFYSCLRAPLGRYLANKYFEENLNWKLK